MKLYIQEKVFSFTNQFSVLDEMGAERYHGEGELLSFGRKMHVYDMEGNEKVLVSEAVLTFMPKFSILVKGTEVAQIKKKFTIFEPEYEIQGLDWKIQGDFFEHNYRIVKDDREIASVHKKWMSWGDSFEIDVVNADDEILVLAVVLAIDCVLDAQQRRSTR